MASDMAGQVKHMGEKRATAGWDWLERTSVGSRVAFLLQKYAQLAQLRTPGAPVASRAVLRELAEAYPGALRQLDQLPAAQLAARLAALEAVGRQPGTEVPPWIALEFAYHQVLRTAIRLRLQRATAPERDLSCWVVTEMPREPGEPDPPWCVAHLGAMLDPPEGRLNGWVVALVASYGGVSSGEMSSDLFGVRVGA